MTPDEFMKKWGPVVGQSREALAGDLGSVCAAVKHDNCSIREHAGLEKVLQKMGFGQPIMPDPELGQNVAFLAHVITTLEERVKDADRQIGNYQASIKDLATAAKEAVEDKENLKSDNVELLEAVRTAHRVGYQHGLGACVCKWCKEEPRGCSGCNGYHGNHADDCKVKK